MLSKINKTERQILHVYSHIKTRKASGQKIKENYEREKGGKQEKVM